jgi:hypothetical protein
MKARVELVPEKGIEEIKRVSPYEQVLPVIFPKEKLAVKKLTELQRVPSQFHIFLRYDDGEISMLDWVYNNPGQAEAKKSLIDQGYKLVHTFENKDQAYTKYTEIMSLFKGLSG